MSAKTSYHNRKILDPFKHAVASLCVVAVLLLIVFLFATIGLLVVPALIVATLVFSLPVHVVLRLLGRRGFYTRNGHTYKWSLRAALDRV
jgi:uncharacterized protein YqhQ